MLASKLNRNPEAPKFLAGWKDISNYLGKGVRTVQRYEREMGLPVRRPAGRSRAAVVATIAELDAWVAASPYRDAFYLPRPAKDNHDITANIRRGMTEMHRLREQMFTLREEVKRTVSILHESIQAVQDGVNDSLRNRRARLGDFGSRDDSLFKLLGIRANGKTN